MKTAMQELISELKRVDDYPMMPFVIRIATDLLEKEKEQIIESYRYGHIDGFTSANHLGTEYKNEEEYYNQTYKLETI